MWEGIPVVGLSAPVLLGLGVFMVLTGWLIPRRTYNDMLHDRDEWRAAHRISEAERIHLAKQVDSLLEVGQTVDAIMHALPHPDDHQD